MLFMQIRKAITDQLLATEEYKQEKNTLKLNNIHYLSSATYIFRQ